MVVLGAGSSGEHFVGALRQLDRQVEIVVVERGLAGGECSYYACIPTKTLLRSGDVVAAARLAPGAAEAVTGPLDTSRVFWWRDQVTDSRDDSPGMRNGSPTREPSSSAARRVSRAPA